MRMAIVGMLPCAYAQLIAVPDQSCVLDLGAYAACKDDFVTSLHTSYEYIIYIVSYHKLFM